MNKVDLPYISFSIFQSALDNNFYLKYTWGNLDLDSKYQVYVSAHQVIDYHFRDLYIGKSGNTVHAFPRDFSEWINNSDIRQSTKGFLMKYQGVSTGAEFELTVIEIGKDIIMNEPIQEALNMRDKLRAGSISGMGSSITIDTSKLPPEMFSASALGFIGQFFIGNIGMGNQ